MRAASTLPLKLTSFNGTINNCTARLSWETAQEENTNYFELQGSTDETYLTGCGRTAAVNSVTGSSYTFSWPQQSAKRFYRLRMVDKDSSSYFSPVISLNSTACSAGNWWVMPNSVRKGEPLRINISTAFGIRNIQIILTTLQGQKLYNSALPVSITGSTIVDVPTRNLSGGVYLISLHDASGQQWGGMQKVIVQ